MNSLSLAILAGVLCIIAFGAVVIARQPRGLVKLGKIFAVVAIPVIGFLIVRELNIRHLNDPVVIEKERVDECFQIARWVMKSPSSTKLLSGSVIGNTIAMKIESANSFGVLLPSDVACTRAPRAGSDGSTSMIIVGMTLDGDPVDDFTFNSASANAIINRDK